MARFQHSNSSEEEGRKRKTLTPAEALARAYKFCAYQERSHQELRNKLYGFGLNTTDVDNIITKMITEGFLNEERFARAFAGGKFRMQKWGRKKIEIELAAHGVGKNCINRGMSEIDSGDYRKTLITLLKKKIEATNEPNPFRKRDKVARFAIGKGYESELVWEVLRSLLPD